MNIDLKKEVAKINEIIYSDFIEKLVDNDIIVPDIKPDILRILEINTKINIDKKIVNQGNLSVTGEIIVETIYVADTEMEENIKNMFSNIPFDFTIDLKNAKPSMQLIVDIETKNVNFLLINSRKINIQTTILANLKLSSNLKLELPVDVFNNKIETKKNTLKTIVPMDENEKKLIISEIYELPTNVPEVYEILKTKARFCTKDVYLSNGEITIKGNVEITGLFSSSDVEGMLQAFEFNSEFDKKFDIPEINENIDSEINYKVKKINCNVFENSDGELKKIQFEIDASIFVKGNEINEISFIEDAYSLTGDLEIENNKQKIEKFMDKLNHEISVKDNVSIISKPEIFSKMYNKKIIPSITNIGVRDGKIFVDGQIGVEINYLVKDPDQPLATLRHDIKFSEILEPDYMIENVVCDAKIETKDIKLTISAGKLDFKFDGQLIIYLVYPTEIKIVEKISLDENLNIKNNRKGIIVYFVKKGDSLWKISKKYKTTPSALISNNKLEGDKIYPGQVLIVS